MLLHRADTDELVNLHVLYLSDAKGAVGGLVLDGRVPPAIKVEDMIGRRQVEADTASFQREDEERRAVPVFLKTLHHRIALLFGRTAVQEEDFAAQPFLQVLAQHTSHLGELAEDERSEEHTSELQSL